MHKGYGISKKYSKKLLFNSRDKSFKQPFGAVATNQKIKITFPVNIDFSAERVDLVLRKDNDTKKLSLLKQRSEKGYDIFYIEFDLQTAGIYFYRFEIAKNNHLCFVGKTNNGNAKIEDWLPEWQLTVYDENYKVPEIYNGGIIYHIFVDRFCKEGEERKPKFGVLKNPKQDVAIQDSNGVYLANDFYGGNFKGIMSKLDYLSLLGVTILYLSPIFESNSNHRYDTADYSKIDYLLGDEKDFFELIKRAKQKGMAIILDGVFNHTGADSLYFNKFNNYPSLGAYQSKESKYYDWYTFYNYPQHYKSWWGITCVPTISEKATGYQNMIAGKDGILHKWTSFGVRGWRLDVVDELSIEFLEKIRKAIKKEDKNALVIGEVWEDASTKESYNEKRNYLCGNKLDGVMNYPFKNAIINYLNSKVDCQRFINQVMTICENYPMQSLNCCMTLLGSHDTVRILNALAPINIKGTTKKWRKEYRLSEKEYTIAREKLLLASCLQYFLPGLPTVYYGDEIGMQGFEDPLNRRFFDWENQDNIILSHYKKLGELRQKYRDAFTGMFDYINGDDEIITIKRQNLILILNLTQNEHNLQGEFYDVLSDKFINLINSMSAVVFIDNN